MQASRIVEYLADYFIAVHPCSQEGYHYADCCHPTDKDTQIETTNSLQKTINMLPADYRLFQRSYS